ncbi:protein Flattop [Cololabis saira]|uniref:protein Flattop n=1 Tax=Cololabis saira TaxID=129043 RepID=UPI002AD2C52B|nr:protein Flattop [Cololabis saira]
MCSHSLRDFVAGSKLHTLPLHRVAMQQEVGQTRRLNAVNKEMSSNYSANQYDGAFNPQKLQNWGGLNTSKRPTARVGHTSFIADDRGHLLPGKVKRGSSWSDFVGTWDLPARTPSQHINATSRSQEGLKRLKSWGIHPQQSSGPLPHRGSRSTDKLPDVGEETSGGVQQDGAAQTLQLKPERLLRTAPPSLGATELPARAMIHKQEWPDRQMNELLLLQRRTSH